MKDTVMIKANASFCTYGEFKYLCVKKGQKMTDLIVPIERDGWIPIEKAFPPYNQRVLLLNLDKWVSPFSSHPCFRILEGSFTPQKGWELEELEQRGIVINVHYWMPYPEIPVINE